MSPGTAQDEPVFTVAAAQLACVRDHADQYRPDSDRSAFIALADCPEMGNPFLSQVTNSGPDIELQETGLDRFLLLRAEEFRCLETLTLPANADIVRFYPHRCVVEPDG